MDRREFVGILGALTLLGEARGFAPANFSKIVYPGKDGRLVYVPDGEGNTIPDFSNCGYMGGGVKLPTVPIRATVEPTSENAGKAIQDAIDKVSALALGKDGFRGAVLIRKGTYKIDRTLVIRASGVVLRGEGDDEKGTVLVATQRKQHTLVEVKGKGPRKATGKRSPIKDAYVPVGSRSFKVESAAGLSVGDEIIVRRIGNKEWIHEIGMDRITPRSTGGTVQWEPFDLDFERVIKSIKGDTITIDAPVVCAIDRRWGGGEVLRVDNSGRINHVGIEGLRGDSEFDPKIKADLERGKGKYYSDEQHSWEFLTINFAENVWVRDVTAIHFGYTGVHVSRDAKWVTVQDSKCLDMISEITGSRRYCFHLEGQLSLVQRCLADTGRHDFVVGSKVCGPNVFLSCKATNSYNTSEPHHRWSVGGLYDNVSAPMAIQDRQWMGTGHGWAGANYVAWNCEGPLVCQKPPTAQNWSIGHVGEKKPGAFAPRQDGYWESLGRHVEPASLYLQQLKDRLGATAVKAIAKT